MTAQKSRDPSGVDRFERGVLRRQVPRLRHLRPRPATIDLPEQFGRVARDEVDNMRLQSGVRGKGGCLSDRLLGPISIAAAQFSKTADEGDGVIRHLRRHGVLRLRLLAVAVFLVFAALVGGNVRQTRHRTANLHRRRGTDIGARRHRRYMRCIKDIGPGAGRMGSGRSDVTDDGNRRRQHIRDDLAHAGGKTAWCIQTQNDDLGASFACCGQSVLHVTGRRRSDRSVDRNGQCKIAVLIR